MTISEVLIKYDDAENAIALSINKIAKEMDIDLVTMIHILEGITYKNRLLITINANKELQSENEYLKQVNYQLQNEINDTDTDDKES